MPTYFGKARDPISSYTHFLAAIVYGFGAFLLVIKNLTSSKFNWLSFTSIVVYGLSMIALYLSSYLYHFSTKPPFVIAKLRKLDHAMIYVLIAGTYTPICLSLMGTFNAKVITVIVWSVALVGIVVKLFYMNVPRWLTSVLYILMGLIIVFDISSLKVMPVGALVLLFLGGAAYILGGIIYAIKKPNFSENFGFHEIFHVLVILGSFFHFLMVFIYVA